MNDTGNEGRGDMMCVCGDCGSVNRIKSTEHVRCKACGSRILYKMRTTKIVQYEAR